MHSTITRRGFVQSAAGFAVASIAADSRAGERRRPNVVLIVGDDMGWTDMGFMGHKEIRTPRLDRLANQGAVFPHGYVPTSLCRASLATLLTGLYPHQHRLCCNDPPKGTDRAEMQPFMKNAPALPRRLGEAGYRSLQTGKFWEGHFSNAGFTHGETTNADRHIATKTPQIGRATMQPIYDFIDQSGKTPFFVWYAPMMPHRPHNPPERLLQRYAVAERDIHIARYFAMCEWFDETVGQLLDHLDKRKLGDDTLVIFVNDNGWITPTAKEDQKSPFGSERGKRSPYDMGIRTPFILRWPGRTRAGRCDDLALTIDLAPTILQASGLKTPARLQGLSLLEVAAGKGKLQRSAIFGEIYVHTATKLGQPDMDVTHRWAREGDWKLIHDVRKNQFELFNLSNDPHERTNQAAKDPDRVGRLRKRIEHWVKDR
ncbi:MAG: sulfatase [Gemmataceae bacterium]|nr:sulfatase [Gemmataceae bacterium]